MKPIRKNNIRLREENNGVFSLFSFSEKKEDREVKFLNQNAAKILSLCNGDMAVDDIVDAIAKDYDTVDRSLLHRDTLNCLHQLKEYGAISWEERMDHIFSNDPLIQIAQEKDFPVISELIQNSFNKEKRKDYLHCVIPIANKAYYEVARVRMAHFHNIEVFCLLENKGQVAGIASMVFAAPPMKSVQLGVFIIRKKWANELLAKKMLQEILLFSKKSKYLRLKWYSYPARRESRFINFLNEDGFQIEAELKDEFGKNKNITIWSKKL